MLLSMARRNCMTMNVECQWKADIVAIGRMALVELHPMNWLVTFGGNPPKMRYETF